MNNQKLRVSPLFIVVEFVKSYKLLIPIIFIFREGIEFWKLAVVGALILFNLTIQTLRYLKTSYELYDDHIIYNTGVFKKEEKYINFANIQNIDTSANMLFQIFNLVSLDINIMAEMLKLAPISRKEANRLITIINKTEHIVLEKETAGKVDISELLPSTTNKNVYLKLGIKDLMLLGLLKSRILLTLFAILAFYDDVDDMIEAIFGTKLFSYLENYSQGLFESVTSILAFLATIFGLLFIISFIVAIVKFYDFSLENKYDKLLCKYGLINKKSLVIKKERIQKVSLEEPMRYRWFKLSSVKITTIATNVMEGLGGNNNIEIIPIAKKEFAEKFMVDILKIDIASYNNEDFEFTPKKARPVIKRWLIFWNLLFFVAIAVALYFIPIFWQKHRFETVLGYVILLAIKIVYDIFKYKFDINNRAIALTNDMIVNKRTFGMSKIIDYLKPMKVGDISMFTNIFMKRRNLRHITINSLGSAADIALRYYDKAYAEKIEEYLLVKGEEKYE